MNAQAQFSHDLADRVAVIRQEIASAAGQIELLQDRLAVLRSSLADAEAAARVLAVPLPAPLPPTGDRKQVGHGAFRSQVLAVLTAAYPHSLRSAAIAREAQARIGAAVHPKTTGMVLNRLKREGLAERTGREWRLMPRRPVS